MNLFVRAVKFLYGLILFLICTRKIRLNDLLEGKRVAVIGAANSVTNSGLGEFIDGFDVVIRLNKAPFMIRDGKGKKDVGSKIDILFHSFFENETFGGGPLDFSLYDSQGVRYVINPIPTFFGYRNIFNYYKKHGSHRKVYTLIWKRYSELERGFDGFRPTTGFCALAAVLCTDVAELYITGFTFFRTDYGDGYRKSLQQKETVRDTMERMKIHNPDVELREYIKLLDSKKGGSVVMDQVLTKIVESERVQLKSSIQSN